MCPDIEEVLLRMQRGQQDLFAAFVGVALREPDDGRIVTVTRQMQRQTGWQAEFEVAPQNSLVKLPDEGAPDTWAPSNLACVAAYAFEVDHELVCSGRWTPRSHHSMIERKRAAKVFSGRTRIFMPMSRNS